jgi:NAD(P)H dehydrogenase (quinone)
MTTIAVIYFSSTGTTARLAQAVIAGAAETGVQVLDLVISGADIDQGRWGNEEIASQLDGADAIIFGTPTYMGSVSGQLKAFFDAMAPRWYTQAWRNKIASGFTASSLAAGDKSSTFVAITTFAMQMGMIWCGTGGSFSEGVNSNGFYFGAGATASAPDQLNEIDLATGRHLGKRVAELTQKLS